MNWIKSFPVTKKLQAGILFIVFIALASAFINFTAELKIEKSYASFKTINESKSILNKFLSILTGNTLGYMDAIVDKDSFVIDEDIRSNHKEFKAWIESHREEIKKAFLSVDPQSGEKLEIIFKDADLYWNSADSMFKDIENKKVDDLGRYDDVIDGKNDEIKNAVLETIKVSDEKFSLASKDLEHAQFILKISGMSASFFILFFSVLILYFLIRDIKFTLSSVGGELSLGSDTVLKTATEFSTLSGQIKDSTTKQASALQETSSAIEEIRSTVERNSELTNTSVEMMKNCHQSATKGKEVSQEMLKSIEEINQSQMETIENLENTATDIKKMMSLIETINQKTSVINDIVFQTKLLSFNASVEAARAGEHGKGFAVVAEEIGNLAQMSGNAAQEINQLLSSSIQQVETVVKTTDQRKNLLQIKTTEMVSKGKNTALESDRYLTDITSKLDSLYKMINEINQASKEQSEGIRLISDAINNLDTITSENVQVANTCAESAEVLNNQSTQLTHSVETLFVTVIGKNA